MCLYPVPMSVILYVWLLLINLCPVLEQYLPAFHVCIPNLLPTPTCMPITHLCYITAHQTHAYLTYLRLCICSPIMYPPVQSSPPTYIHLYVPALSLYSFAHLCPYWPRNMHAPMPILVLPFSLYVYIHPPIYLLIIHLCPIYLRTYFYTYRLYLYIL